MSKTATIKKLRCPAYVKKSKPAFKDGSVALKEEPGHWMCEFSIDLTKTEELKANRDLLIHISKSHPFYWKRHGKQLVLRHNKKVAMRG